MHSHAFGYFRMDGPDGHRELIESAAFTQQLHTTLAGASQRSLSDRARAPHSSTVTRCVRDDFGLFWSCCRSRAKFHSRGKALGWWWLYWVSFGGRVRAWSLDVEVVLAIAGMVSVHPLPKVCLVHPCSLPRPNAEVLETKQIAPHRLGTENNSSCTTDGGGGFSSQMCNAVI